MSEAKELAEWQVKRTKTKNRFERMFPMVRQSDYECFKTKHFAKRYKKIQYD